MNGRDLDEIYFLSRDIAHIEQTATEKGMFFVLFTLLWSFDLSVLFTYKGTGFWFYALAISNLVLLCLATRFLFSCIRQVYLARKAKIQLEIAIRKVQTRPSYETKNEDPDRDLI